MHVGDLKDKEVTLQYTIAISDISYINQLCCHKQ